MKIVASIIAATLGSAAAFTATPLSIRTDLRLRSDATADESVETAVDEVDIAPPAEEVLAVPGSVSSSAFCRGYVGGEGPEPMLMGGTSINWDPAGFTQRAPEWVPWFREAELKHGRAAMLATVGFIVPQFMRIPGEQFSFESIPNVIDAHDALPDSMGQIFLWISVIEAMTFPALANMDGYDREPGDFSFDPLGIYPSDPVKQNEYKLAELKNGRLAMIAIGGMVTGAAITGTGFPYLP